MHTYVLVITLIAVTEYMRVCPVVLNPRVLTSLGPFHEGHLRPLENIMFTFQFIEVAKLQL